MGGGQRPMCHEPSTMTLRAGVSPLSSLRETFSVGRVGRPRGVSGGVRSRERLSMDGRAGQVRVDACNHAPYFGHASMRSLVDGFALS